MNGFLAESFRCFGLDDDKVNIYVSLINIEFCVVLHKFAIQKNIDSIYSTISAFVDNTVIQFVVCEVVILQNFFAAKQVKIILLGNVLSDFFLPIKKKLI